MRSLLTPTLLGLALLVATDAARAAQSTPPSPPAASRTHATAPQEQKGSALPGAKIPVAIARKALLGAVDIQVQSTDLRAGAPIDARFTAYGQGQSPALSWSAVKGAQSWAVLLEDPDVARAEPFAHWVAWNIPAHVQALPGDLPAVPQPDEPAGMRQGRNGKGKPGYFGPRPPAGDPPHHYHVQVLALDRKLDLPPDADRDALVRAMAGHVLGSGELVATSVAPPDATPAP